MNVSHASVHPVEDPPTTDGGNAPRVRMKDIQGMPGTPGGLTLRICQLIFAVAALCVMATTNDFPSVTAFCYEVRGDERHPHIVMSNMLSRCVRLSCLKPLLMVCNFSLLTCSSNVCTYFQTYVHANFLFCTIGRLVTALAVYFRIFS
ncbi:CASP-like protein 5A2 isoform X2 [Mangifera indica]|uniref:CASP-like protein 5A2 isoform X2 n=1 Tax=Mangifera indica TaxID=29780 RepID=UPI001CFA0C2F|nr:CASP-like protein 5A2 isoform X2 [Mangifera indica]